MGFSCGFYSVPKHNDVNTVKKFQVISEYVEWKNNPWNFENDHYPTFEKYWNGFCKWLGEYPGEPNPDDVAFYEHWEKRGKYSLCNEIESWCSSGRYIDEFITDNLKPIDEWSYGLIDEKFIEDSLSWVNEEIENCKLIPVYLKCAVRKNDDGTSTMIPCDSIMVEDDDGNIKEFSVNPEWGECIYVPSRGFDEDKEYTLKSFKDALYKMREEVKEGNMVWYSRSW